jgi:hypothetical protein
VVSELEGDLATFRDSLVQEHAVPCALIVDVDSGEHQLLGPGVRAVVRQDGRSVLVRGGPEYSLFGDFDGARPWRRIDVPEAGAASSTDELPTSEAVHIPGDWRGVIAYLEDDLVIYFGLPTEGTPERYTTNNSNFVGAKPMGSIKLADLRTGAFVTLVPHVDPRWPVTWGPFDVGAGEPGAAGAEAQPAPR